MNIDAYQLIESYMLSCMQDSAHDKEHVYRVLYMALDIASKEGQIKDDVLIAACLLHDIGRKEQFENPSLCHAAIGAEKAYHFLLQNGFEEDFAKETASCIKAHRFRTGHPPVTTEEKILFDSDKLDAAGTLGIARTIFYQGQVGEPLYTLTEDGDVSDGSLDTSPSFFQEYKYKLEQLYSSFYTDRGKELALLRQQAAVSFYENMVREAKEAYQTGKTRLSGKIDNRT